MMNNSLWNNLSIRDKAAWFKFAVLNGITNTQLMAALYNEYAEGGFMEEEQLPEPSTKQEIENFYNADVNAIDRLNNLYQLASLDTTSIRYKNLLKAVDWVNLGLDEDYDVSVPNSPILKLAILKVNNLNDNDIFKYLDVDWSKYDGNVITI